MSRERRAAKVTTLDLRKWAREVYPMLDDMSPRQVRANRAKWCAAVTYLGPTWRMLDKDIRREKSTRPLRVVA